MGKLRPVRKEPLSVIVDDEYNLGDFNTVGDNAMYAVLDEDTIPKIDGHYISKYLKWAVPYTSIVEKTQEEKTAIDLFDFSELKALRVQQITQSAIGAVKAKYPPEVAELYLYDMLTPEVKSAIDADKEIAKVKAKALYDSIDLIHFGNEGAYHQIVMFNTDIVL